MNKKKNQIQYAENPLGSIATINQANGVVSEERVKKIEHKRIDEGGLSRLYSHIKDNNTFAVIGSQDKDTGEDRSQELYNIAMLGRFKFKGFNWLLGTYTYDDPDKPVARENSMIFYNISKEDALRIGKKLNQETILWKDPEFFGYIYVDSGEVPEWNKGGFSGGMSFNPETIKNIGGSSSLVGKGWSVNQDKLKSKNQPFVYECFLVEPALKTGYVSEYLIDSYTNKDGGNDLKEDTKPKKANISNITLSSLKRLASTSTRATKDQARDFKYATHVDPVASVLEETDKAYLLKIGYYRWNEDRTGKVKRFVTLWYPKNSTLEGDVYKRVRENKGTNPKIKSRGIRESLAGSEYFTKEEIKTLPREIEDYLQEQPIPKYYDISVEDMGDKQYVLRGNIDYGDLSHDHRYFDTKVKEFFDSKGISVDIYEPDDLRGNDDGDGIYSSAHIIQKSGNRVYVPQDNELDNFID